MCLPAVLAVASTAVSIGSTVASYAAQSQAANAQAKFQNKQYSQNAEIAKANYLRGLGQLSLRLQQSRAADATDALQNALAASSARGSTAAQAAERGVDGNSVMALMNEYTAIEAFNRNVISTNADWQERQAYEEALALEAQAKGQIASATPAPVQRPNLFAAGLTIGGDLLTGTNRLMQMRRDGPYRTSTPQQVT